MNKVLLYCGAGLGALFAGAHFLYMVLEPSHVRYSISPGGVVLGHLLGMGIGAIVFIACLTVAFKRDRYM